MPSQQTIQRVTSGLQTHANRLNQVPPGALATAKNVVVDREGVISSRRGFKRYGQALSQPATQIFEYKKTLLVLDGQTIKYDSDLAGTWIAWPGSYSPPPGVRMRFLESNSNFYFTSLQGVFKNDSLAGTPIRAGMPKGLDMQAAFLGTGAGWFTPDTQVGYRVIFGREDANNNLLLGAPSEREKVTNALSAVVLDWAGGVAIVRHVAHGFANGDTITISGSGEPLYNGTFTITLVNSDTYTYPMPVAPADTTDVSGNAGKAYTLQLTFTIPPGVQSGDFYELYRTQLSANANADPLDEHFKLIRNTITSAEITAGFITYNDTFDSAFLGERLYTNQTQEGATQQNDRPPWCKFMAHYKNHVFYANILYEHHKDLQLLSIDGITDGTDSISFTRGGAVLRYTFAAAEDQALRKFKRFTTESTAVRNIEKTAKSLARIINRDLTGFLTCEYISGVNDPPGKLAFFSRTINQVPFSITANVTLTGGKFTPVLPTSGTSVSSKDDMETAGVARSKYRKPEAVPRGNNNVVGRKDKAILGMLALKDYLIIFKEDGIFVITGETDGASGSLFIIDEIDPTIRIRGLETATTLDNAVFLFSTQGVIRLVGDSSGIVSRSIEKDILRLAQQGVFETFASATSYESDKKYILFTQRDSSDLNPKEIQVYNYLTNTWVQWKKPANWGLVLSRDDKLYLAHAEDNYILQERKSLSPSHEDFQDETIDITVLGVGTSTFEGRQVSTLLVNYTYYAPLTTGFLFEQGNLEGKVVSGVNQGGGNYAITLDRLISVQGGPATLTLPIYVEVEWQPDPAGNASAMKYYSFFQVYLEGQNVTRQQIGFRSDIVNTREFSSVITAERAAGWGSVKWGSSEWGSRKVSGGTVVRAAVPRNHRRCRALQPIYRHNVAKERVDILQAAFDVRPYGTRTQRKPL